MYKFIILLIFIIPFYSISNACICGSKPNIIDSWEIASQVFIGEVIGIDTSDNFYSAQGVKEQLYTIRILESFKYDNYKGNNIRTFTNSGEGSCDYYFTVGYTYLIYAYTSNFATFLSASECSRTGLLRNVGKRELEELEKLHNEFKFSKDYSGDMVSIMKRDRDNGLLIVANDRLKREKSIIIIISSILIILLIVSLIILWRKKFVK